MYRLFLSLLLLVFISCESTTENTKTSSSATTESEEEDDTEVVEKAPEPNKSVQSLTENQLKKFRKYLKPQTVTELNDFIETLRFVKTDTAFEKAYHGAQPLIKKMETEIGKRNDDPTVLIDDLAFMDKVFALRPSCVAECTEFTIEFTLKDLKALAKETTGEMDDRFFAMKEFCEGDLVTYDPGWFTYFERTWDYGGGVDLGNGQISKFLKTSYQFQKETTLFKKDVDQLRSETIGIMGHPVYMKSQAEVLAEMEKILKGGMTSAKERKLIQEIKDRNVRNDREEEHLLQFGCESGDCDWGG